MTEQADREAREVRSSIDAVVIYLICAFAVNMFVNLMLRDTIIDRLDTPQACPPCTSDEDANQ